MAAITYPISATEAEQEIRSLLNEVTASFWTSEQITNFILQAVMDVSAKLHCFQARDTSTIALTASTLEYAQPTGCLKVFAATYRADSTSYLGLQRIHPMMIGHLQGQTTGAPEYYYHAINKIGVWPLPTASEATKKVEILMSKQTSDIANIPDQYQNLVLWFSTALALLKDKKFGASAHYYSMYLNSVAFHRADIVEYMTDAADMFRVPDSLMKGA